MFRSILSLVLVCVAAVADDGVDNEKKTTASESVATFQVNPKFITLQSFEGKELTVIVNKDGALEIIASPLELPKDEKRAPFKFDGEERSNTTYAPGTRLCQKPLIRLHGYSEDQAFRECWNTVINRTSPSGYRYSEGSVEWIGRSSYMCYGVYVCGRR